jgi:hypothetical protein
MITEKDLELVSKYLKSNYSINRVKDKDRFKRAIVSDKGIYFISDKNNKAIVKKEIFKTLDIIFGFDQEINAKLVKGHLNF